MQSLARDVLIDSLLTLGERLRQRPIPPEVANAALRENPWFTAYYLQKSVAGIAQWLQEDELSFFLAQYPERVKAPQRVGIIAAGNLPLVGWHDVLIALLSGHQVFLRCSHQDRAMMRWLKNSWEEILPKLSIFLHETNNPNPVDYLLATGSNNSARYFRRHFASTPKLIRRHRYSVAYLPQDIDDQSLRALNDDLLLYNGLGCRNVSNLLLGPGFELDRLRESITTYPQERVNPLYLERVLYANHLKGVLGESTTSTPYALLQPSLAPGSSEMGVLRYIPDVDPTQLAAWQRAHQHEWQCLVGKGVTYGQSQCPQLDDFADNVDTMALLLHI